MPSFDDVLSAVSANPSQLKSRLAAWEQSVVDTFNTRGMGNEVQQRYLKEGLNFRDMLDLLPRSDSRLLKNQYAEIIGFNALTASDNFGSILQEVKPEVMPKRGFGVLPSSSIDSIRGTNPLLHTILSGINIGFETDSTGAIGYHLGGNILKHQYIEGVTSASTGAIKDGAKIFFYDTETGGLGIDQGIRSISGQMTQINAGSLSTIGSTVDTHLRTYAMQRGAIYSGGALMPLEKYTLQSLSPDELSDYMDSVPFEGDRFAKNVKSFLTEMADSDYIGGHNVQFDLQQTILGLKKTGTYQTDLELQNLIGRIEKKVANGEIIDSMAAAKNALPDLMPSEFLKATGSYQRHSIANIILKTNLAENLMNDLGSADDVMQLLGATGAGTHASDVDAILSSYIYKYANAGTLTEIADESTRFSGAARAGALTRSQWSKIYQATIKSYAPTPISNIADIEHVDPRVLAKLLGDDIDAKDYIQAVERRTGGVTVRSMLANLTPNELHAQLSALHSQEIGSTSDIIPFSLKVNPIEQEILTTRQLFNNADTGDVSTATLTRSIGNWRRLTNADTPYSGMLNKIQTFFRHGTIVGESEYSAFQDQLRSLQVPFAGLSREERWFTSMMSEATSGYRMGEDIGVSSFDAIRKAYVSGNAANISLPPELLRAAEQAKILEQTALSADLNSLSKPKLLDYSFANSDGNPRFTVRYNMTDSESSRLINWLDQNWGKNIKVDGSDVFLEDLMGSESSVSLQQVKDALAETQKRGRGVIIASAQGKQASQIQRGLESINLGLITDDARLRMGGGLLGYDGEKISVGAWTLNRGIDASEERFIAKELVAQRNRWAQFTNRPGIHKVLSQLGDSEGINFVQGLLDNYTAAKSNGVKAIAVASVIGLAAYSYKKYRESEEISEPLEQQPYESAISRGYIDDSMINYGQNRLDPLATANTISMLREQGIGHTGMGPNKYNNLYGGK